MGESVIQVNRQGKLQVRQVGREQTPVIMIDDFAEVTDEVIRLARGRSDYGPDRTSAYPGLRASLPRDYVITVLNAIFRLLFQVYQVPAELNLKPVNTVYSLITTPETELALAQRVPHFDSNGPYYLAVLHYLNEGDFCDTGLFRHRPTGYERITEERKPGFLESSRRYMEQHGEPPSKYINGSEGQYELYERIEYKPNRLVAYPGNLLHSGLVNPAVDVDPDPESGRLTANIFVDFVPSAQGERRGQ